MLTGKHLAILAKLREDARVSLAKVSRDTGLPNSTVFDYYEELKNGPILRHTTLPDFSRLGYPLRKKFIIRSNDRDGLFTFLRNHQNVNNLYRIDHAQALCEAYFSSIAEVETFKQELRQYVKPKELREFDVLEELKHEAFLPEGKPI